MIEKGAVCVCVCESQNRRERLSSFLSFPLVERLEGTVGGGVGVQLQIQKRATS